MLMSTAREGSTSWRYTLENPGEGWEQPAFDASSWSTGEGGFGHEGTPRAVIGTPWTSTNIWLRRTVVWPEAPGPGLRLVVHHDEDALVYFNGVPAVSLGGYTVGYRVFPVAPEARAALRAGPNLVAVQCSNQRGGQFIDLGLVSVSE